MAGLEALKSEYADEVSWRLGEGDSPGHSPEASARILARKIEMLARDFADLAALDASAPDEQKRSMGFMLALRPWVFSMYQGLRSQGKA